MNNLQKSAIFIEGNNRKKCKNIYKLKLNNSSSIDLSK